MNASALARRLGISPWQPSGLRREFLRKQETVSPASQPGDFRKGPDSLPSLVRDAGGDPPAAAAGVRALSQRR